VSAQPIETEGRVFDKMRYFEETGYYPHDGQEVIHLSSARHRVLCNGRRWGKTLMGAKEVEPQAFVKNRFGAAQRGWIVGPNYTDCEKEFRVVFDTFKSLGVDRLSSKFTNNVENGNMHITTNWGFDLECRSAQHPESLVGEGLDFVLMVEAGRHHRRTWAQYIRPALSDKRGWSIHSGVPEGTSQESLLYHLWKRGQDPRNAAWQSYRMPSWTNNIIFPGGRNDPEILEAEQDLTPEEFDRQYGALFVEKVGRVMQEWDDDLHVKKLQYNPNWPLYLAIDYGYTNDWVLLFIQVDQWENAYVIREKRWKLKDTEAIAEEILQHPSLGPLVRKAVAIYPDPAAPDDTAIFTRKTGIPARGNTGGEIKTRLAMVRKRLKPMPEHADPEDQQPSLLVDESCTMLIWEMREGYRWPEHRSEIRNESENPLDKDNHGPEALGRFVKGYYEVQGEGKGRSAMSKVSYRRR
jgi:hypothetical protein